MTIATARSAIRQELYNQVPGLGFFGTADSFAATSMTHTYVFQDSIVGPNFYRGMYLYRPSSPTPADVVRKISTLVPSSGVISISGPNYTDTTTLPYEIVGLIHPDELNACIQRAIRRVFFDVQSVLPGGLTDGDMDSSDTSAWTGSGAITLTKITTPAFVYSGIRSLECVNSQPGHYAESVTMDAMAGEWFYASAVVRCASGTCQLTAYDKTNSANIGAGVQSAEDAWVHLWYEDQFPVGCKRVSVRLSGIESDADIVWAHVVFYRRDQLSNFPAPSWLDEQYKFQKLRQASYVKPIPNPVGVINAVGYDDAQSRVFKDWAQPFEFELEPLNKDSNPYQITLMRQVPRDELWIQCRRPYSDLEALSADTDTTVAPLNQLYAVAKEELARLLRMRYPQDKRWDNLFTEATQQVIAETQSRPELPFQPIKREFPGRI